MYHLNLKYIFKEQHEADGISVQRWDYYCVSAEFNKGLSLFLWLKFIYIFYCCIYETKLNIRRHLVAKTCAFARQICPPIDNWRHCCDVKFGQCVTPRSRVRRLIARATSKLWRNNLQFFFLKSATNATFHKRNTRAGEYTTTQNTC